MYLKLLHIVYFHSYPSQRDTSKALSYTQLPTWTTDPELHLPVPPPSCSPYFLNPRVSVILVSVYMFLDYIILGLFFSKHISSYSRHAKRISLISRNVFQKAGNQRCSNLKASFFSVVILQLKRGSQKRLVPFSLHYSHWWLHENNIRALKLHYN